jgi:multiple sugar transport system permease protein
LAYSHREEGGRSNAAAWWASVKALRTESWGEAVAGYLFIGPAILLFFTFNAYPVIRGLMIAFSDYRYLIPGHSPFNGVDNWVEMAADPLFLSSFARSLQYTAIYFVLNFVVAFLVAVLISQIANQREAGAYRVIAYLPVILPIAVALLVWRQLLNPEFGYVRHILVNWLGTGAPDFLRDANWAVPVLAIIGAWKVMGTNVLLLLVGLYNINTELYEAAAIDGAGWWRRLFHITIPLLRPTFTIIFVLAAGVLGEAEASLVFYGLTDAGPEGAGRLIGRYAYEVSFLLGDLRWGYAAAMNLTVGLTSMIISALVFRALRSGRI